MLIKTLLVKLGLDAGDYHKGLSEAQEATTSGVAGIVSNLSRVGGAVVMGALGVATAGAIALGGGIGLAVTEAMGAQEVMAQTQAVIESTGGAAGMTAEQIADMATSLSLQSRFSDDAIQTGQNLLLTFTNIGEETFPAATQAMVDMAAAMGTDVKGGAIQLGKALNDPIAGISALSRVGVSFTEDQKAVIASLVETGDVAGAQAIILAELNREFGGSAAAAAETFGGKLDVMKNRLLNVAEGIGMSLLPVLTMLFDNVIAPALPIVERLGEGFGLALGALLSGDIGGAFDILGEFFNDVLPGSAELFYTLGGAVEDFVGFVQANIPLVQETLATAWAWLQENEGVIVGVFVALGVAVAAFVWTTVIPAAAAMIAALAPIVLPIIAIVAVVALLYEAWQNNWGGIRDTLTAFWTNTGQPLLAQLQAWLAENIPVAIATLKSFWETVLLPAIQAVWAWMTGTLFPTLSELWVWLQDTLTAALTTLATFWTTTLLPALTDVWNFIQTDLQPLFVALVDFLNAAFTLAVTALAGLWQNVLQPALQAVGDYVMEHLQPILDDLVEFWENTLGPKITAVKTGVLDALPGIFQSIRDAIGWVVGKIGELTAALSSVELPWWLTPGSPTPWETGLVGVARAMDDLSRRELPAFAASLKMQVAGVPAGGGSGGIRIDTIDARGATLSRSEIEYVMRQVLNEVGAEADERRRLGM